MRLFKELAFAATLSLASIFAIASGHAHEIKLGDIVISHPWSRPAPMASDVAAGFMKITNTGTADDRLVSATAAITGTVQLHDMKMEGDVMKMSEIPGGIVIPTGQTVELKPKSLHVMFMDLKRAPVEGEQFKGTLTFEKAGTVEIDYEVTAQAPEAH
ncbi:MAG: copper chaperone PCu(A)C [Alphaproteobacteria bacterium]|nr:copper chaperone PCu(A)C [Alphaproteobacteria bacterium]